MNPNYLQTAVIIHKLPVSRVLLDKSVRVSVRLVYRSVDKGLKVDEWLNPTWIPISTNVSTSLRVFLPLSFPLAVLHPDVWPNTRTPSFDVKAKHIVERSTSVCEGKDDYKAKHPDLFPFVASSPPLSILIFYRRVEMGDLFHVGSRMRGVFPDDGTAWPSCLGREWAACRSRAWVDGSKINTRGGGEEKKAPEWIMNWHSVCFLWLWPQHWGG